MRESEARHRLGKKVVDDEMRKRLGEAVFGGACLAGAARGGGVEGQSTREIDRQNRAQL
jgi:hypothetical protein